MWKYILGTAFLVLLAGSLVNSKTVSIVARIPESPMLYDVDQICSQRPLELVFIVDASSSIWYQNFTKAKTFVHDFVGQYEIGKDKVRIGVVTFGKGVYTQDVINLSKYDDLISLQAAIQHLPFRAGTRTDTGLAIRYARTTIMAESRPGVRRVAVVITDGNSQEPDLTASEAALSRKEMDVFSVGVSDRVSHAELVNIAGDEDGVFYVNKYSELENIKGRLAMKTCIPVVPSTTKLPNNPSCGIVNPADVYFVFDPASLGLGRTLWVTSFIKDTVKTDDMEYMQVGVISGSCPLDAGFPLNRYNNSAEIESHLSIFEKTKLPRLVNQLAENGYSKENGGRPGERQVAVLFLGGKVHDSGSILQEVKKAADKNIQLFFANTGDADSTLMNSLSAFGTRLDSSVDMQRQISEFLLNLCTIVIPTVPAE